MQPGENNIFAKIVRGEIPSNKVGEDEHWYAFLDINPMATNHTLVVPKHNVVRSDELPDEALASFGPFLRRVTRSVVKPGQAYNILQNNGSPSGQVVMYVHFHIIPKNDSKDGLTPSFPSVPPGDKETLAKQAAGAAAKFAEQE